MLRDVRKLGLILFLLCLVAGVQAQAMPDFVLRAAQAINARYGQRVDLNNLSYWDYHEYSADQKNPRDLCRDMEASAPPFPAGNDNYYIVTFSTNATSQLPRESWDYLVYGDLSYLGPCVVPQPPTPVPTQGPTAIPPTQSNCFGLVPRLAIGQQGRVTPGDPNNVRENHGVSTRLLGEIPGGAVFTVLDGPRCTNDGTWWRVDYNGLQGWTLEGNGGVYFTEPASFALPVVETTAVAVVIPTQAPTFTPAPILPTIAPTKIVCLPTIPPRLRIGETARVTAGGIPNNIREQGGRSAKLIGEIPPLGLFTVLEGPTCTGDGAWWRVDYNGLQGWTLEGMEAEYWVEPILPNLQPMTLANVSQMRPLPNWVNPPEAAGWLPSLLSNDGSLGVRNGAVGRSGTLIDVFASAETFSWQLASDAPVIEPLVLENGHWNVSGLPVSIAPDAVITDAKLSADSRWVIFSQGVVLSTINRSPEVAEVDRIKTLPDIHGEAILTMDFSADSRTLVTISAHAVYAWDTTTWQPRLIYTLSSIDPVTEWPADLNFAISPSGQHLFVSPGNIAMGLVISLQSDIQGRWASLVSMTQVTAAAFVRDEWIAVGGLDNDNNGLLIALPVATLQAIPLLSEAPIGDVPNAFLSIAINTNGTMMATYNVSGTIRLWGAKQP